MRNIQLSVEFITGFSVGFEWVAKGVADEELGFLAFDLGIARFILSYE